MLGSRPSACKYTIYMRIQRKKTAKEGEDRTIIIQILVLELSESYYLMSLSRTLNSLCYERT